MNELNFTTPTAEGEYRAKQAKTKLPISNNFKKQKVQEQQPAEVIIEEPVSIQVDNPAQTAQAEISKNKRKNSNRRNKFNKNKEIIETIETVETAETVIKPEEEIKPVLEVADLDTAEKPKKRRTRRTKKSEAKVE